MLSDLPKSNKRQSVTFMYDRLLLPLSPEQTESFLPLQLPLDTEAPCYCYLLLT